MLKLLFEGYFQMRMATDPDPPDDPRGLSGYTLPCRENLISIISCTSSPMSTGRLSTGLRLPGAPGP